LGSEQIAIKEPFTGAVSNTILQRGEIMDNKTLQFLARYNAITNEKMNRYIAELSDDQRNQKFGGYFTSIRSLCNHLYITDFNWLKRFSNLRTFDYIRDDFFRREHAFGTHAFLEKKDYLAMRSDLDKRISQFTDELREDDLSRKLRYNDSHGTEHNQEFGLTVLHFFNHQTHHRGMVSIYLEEMGIANDYSNIMDII